MEEERETDRKAVAAFMAFGTKGDVYPIAAVAAAFAVGQERHRVVLITHSAHENLASHLEERSVDFVAIKSPPALSINENHDSSGSLEFESKELDFSLRKRIITNEHRRECYSAIEQIFGPGPSMEGDFILINLFALEGWSLAELFRVRCMVAAPYVVPYSAPSTFEDHFSKDLPLLYKHLRAAPSDKVCWKDVTHWMWPLFTENWGLWRSDELNLSACPFTDPVTGLPAWHDWPPSPLLLYGFSKEIVECPDYWPSNVRVCGFWFLPMEWQFSCKRCGKNSKLSSLQNEKTKGDICSVHVKLQCFLRTPASVPPIFIGLSSAGSMGFLGKPHTFLQVLQTVLAITNYRFILFTAGYEPLDEAVKVTATDTSCLSEREYNEEGVDLFDGRLFCFPGMMSYKWLFPRCAAAIHHGGSGSTAAALHGGIPQVLCPFMFDQFYWAEKMHWIGVAPEPLNSSHLIPDRVDDMSIKIAADMLSRAIKKALSPEVKARALQIAERISVEDGISEAVKILKKEMNCSN